MLKVDFLICGRRGFNVLQNHIKEFGTNSVNVVCSYSDKKVKDDPFDELVHYCNVNDISLVSKDDYIVSEDIFRMVIGWQWMFTPGNKTIVLHDSLLPKYRGFAPLVTSLVNGETFIGVTAFLANESFDEGSIISQSSVPVSYPITIRQAIEQLTPLYCTQVSQVYQLLNSGKKLQLRDQDHSLASYCLWRDEEDYRINWKQSADEIMRFIDAVGYPYSGASTYLKNETIIIESASLYPDVKIENRTEGKVIFIKEGLPVVVCKAGLLKINAAYNAKTGKSILPFKFLRSRFI